MVVKYVRAYSYIRFSHITQINGDSLRRQREWTEAYCRRKGWTLDTSLTLRDLGVSAFRGKNALVGNLGYFLRAVEEGTVPPGSALIVESLDRISRQGVDEGYDIIKRLLKAGIIIVTLSPEREYDREAIRGLCKGVLEILVILERAAEESERKSQRVGAAWAQKRKAARQGRLVTRRLPGWIEERDGKPHLIPRHAATVKHIFHLAAEGFGQKAIVAKLKAEGVPTFLGVVRHRDKENPEIMHEKPGEWNRVYVKILLNDRRVLGEFQPKNGDGSPDGPPIPDYFPRIITEQEWYAARAGCAKRDPAKGHVRQVELKLTDIRFVTATEDGREKVEKANGHLPDAFRPGAKIRYLATPEETRLLTVNDFKRLRLPHPRRYISATLQSIQGATLTLGVERRGRWRGTVELFTGMLKDARDGGSMMPTTRTEKGTRPSKKYGRSKQGVAEVKQTRLIINTASNQTLGGKEGTPCVSFPLPTFEKAILTCLREIKPNDVLGTADPGKELAASMALLEADLDRVRRQRATLAPKVKAGEDLDELLAALRELKDEEARLTRELDEARAKNAQPVETAWQEFGSLVEVLEQAPDPVEARTRLAALLRRMVKEIRLLVVPRGRDRLCAVAIYFEGGGRRDYLIWHCPPKSNGKATVPGWWRVRSWRAEPLEAIGLPQPDLGNPNDVPGMEGYLSALRTDDLEKLVFADCPKHPLA